MKKIFVLLLCLILALSTAACGPKNDSDDTAGDTVGDTAGDTTPKDTTPKDTTPKDTTPKDTTPKDTTPKDTTPEDTTPKDTTPKDTAPKDTTPPDTTEPEDSTPGFVGPGFQIGPGGIVTPGQGGGDTTEDIPVTDAGDLVDQLDALCQGIVEGSFTESLRSSGEFSNYFDGAVKYTEGMRVAMNHLEMAPPAHVVMLIEVPAGEDAKAYAKDLNDNANPRWMVCASANSVQYAVKDDLVLFVMSSTEIADAVVAAFNG